MKKKTNNLRKRIVSLSVAVVAALGLLTGCGEKESTTDTTVDQSSEKQVIRVGVMTGAIEHFILLEGLEQNIYEKYGLDIQYTEFATGVDAVGAIATNQIDIAEIFDFGLINRLGQTSSESELRVIAQNYVAKTDVQVDNALALYVNPETVTTKDDLKGKKISVSLGTQNEYQNAKLFEELGLVEGEDITQVPIEAIADVIAVAKNKEIDAAWSSGPSAELLQNEGWVPLISGDEVGLVNRNIAVASDVFADKTDVIANYFAARQEIVKYIADNEDEAYEFISAKTGVQLQQAKSLFTSYDLTSQIDQATYDSLVGLKEWAVNKELFEDFDLDKFIKPEGLKKQFPENVSYSK